VDLLSTDFSQFWPRSTILRSLLTTYQPILTNFSPDQLCRPFSTSFDHFFNQFSTIFDQFLTDSDSFQPNILSTTTFLPNFHWFFHIDHHFWSFLSHFWPFSTDPFSITKDRTQTIVNHFWTYFTPILTFRPCFINFQTFVELPTGCDQFFTEFQPMTIFK
jgi:hypothetical protein